MLKIKDKRIEHSTNVEGGIDRVFVNKDGDTVLTHNLLIRPTFKDFWRYITGKDYIHVITTTIIEYEEINNTANTNNTPTDKPSKKSSRPKKSKTTSTNSESTDSK